MNVSVSNEPGGSDLLIGTCAWSFDQWRGAFYPPGLPSSERLRFYSRYFRTVEVDSTFYSTPSQQVLEHWMGMTPDNFRFNCKLPRELTHDAHLRDCEQPFSVFLEALRPLREKLGCILVQLPPSFEPHRDEQTLRKFLHQLPPGWRFAIEFRNRDWDRPGIVHQLEEHGVCRAWADVTTLEQQETAVFELLPQTSDFLYIRLMGDLTDKYSDTGEARHRYDRFLWSRERSLANWALKIRRHLGEAKSVFVMVNNHFEGFGPLTCQRMAHALGLQMELPPKVTGPGEEERADQLPLF